MREERVNALFLQMTDEGQEALSLLYLECKRDVLAFSLSILGDYQKAEDVVQEVFLKVRAYGKRCVDVKNPSGWLMRITKNAAIDLMRKTREIPYEEPLLLRRMESESREAEGEFLMGQIVKLLSEKEREIVVLHLVSDMTFKAIGEVLGIALPTVKWRYRTAIKRLQKTLDKKEWE